MGRLQTVLIFHDEDLYNGLVVPFKENKELNPLLIRLLTSYYYSEEVREAVDNYNNYVTEDVNSGLSYDSSIAKAQDALAMLNAMTQSALNIAEDGIATINTIAKASGGTPTQNTSFGMELPTINSLEGVNVSELGSLFNVSQNDTSIRQVQTTENITQQTIPETKPVAQIEDKESNARISALETDMSELKQMMATLISTQQQQVQQMSAQMMYSQAQYVQPQVQYVQPPISQVMPQSVQQTSPQMPQQTTQPQQILPQTMQTNTEPQINGETPQNTATEPARQVIAELPKPEIAEITKPEVAEVSRPVVAEVSRPVVSKTLKPETTETSADIDDFDFDFANLEDLITSTEDASDSEDEDGAAVLAELFAAENYTYDVGGNS